MVIDKGMNADDNYAWIDEHSRMHFITTYSTYFAQDLAPIRLRIAVILRTAGRLIVCSYTGPRESTGGRREL